MRVATLRFLLLALLAAACAGAPPTRVYHAEQDARVITANGMQFAYLAAGDPKDPLVLLLHGFPDTPHAWDTYRPALAAQGYYVVSPFLRGYAPSQIPGEDDYSIQTIGHDVLGLISAFGKHQADVVGHDWGAMAAYSAAAQEPRKIRKLVTLVIPHPANIKAQLRDARRLRHFIALKQRRADKRFAADDYAGVDELYARWSPTWRSTPQDREPVKNTFAAPGSLHGALGYYRELSAKTIKIVQHPTQVPTLVIAGRDDGTTPLRSFANETPFAAGVRIETLPTGHFPHRERPDLVLPLIKQFLGAPPPAAIVVEPPPAEQPAAAPPVAAAAARDRAARSWPLDLTRELPGGCFAWSASERAAACITGGGSIQSGHTYYLTFVGGDPETTQIADWPPHDLTDHPLIIAGPDRPHASARFIAGNYVPLPAPTGELTPHHPYVGESFTLRWLRRKSGHINAGSGKWDTFDDRIEIACKARNPVYLPLFTNMVENPGKDDAAVYQLSPTQLLVHRVDVWGVQGDAGSREEAAFVDLTELGCR